jgi:Xaa-Pro aminopeptidase
MRLHQMDYIGRIDKLRLAMRHAKVDALLVIHMPNVRYLCGFTGSSGSLLVTKDHVVLFTDGRYTQQAKSEVKNASVKVAKGSPLLAAIGALAGRGKVLGFEAERMPVAIWREINSALPRGWKLRPRSGILERLRMIKEPAEIELIRRAVKLGSHLFRDALAAIRPDTPENVVAAEIEYAARKAGAEKMSFETIVAGGKRSALPHGVASAAPLPKRGFVLLDFGVILAGYCSDMSRTLHVGTPNTRSRHFYQAVLDAQLKAIESVRAGVPASQVDRAARGVLGKAGVGKFFTHSCGHGLGLEIHEPPRLGKGQQELLQSGMVVTVEPGAYLPGEGGVRIEDVVVVTQHGCEVLTPTKKELIAL